MAVSDGSEDMQKNFRKIPKVVLTKLRTIPGDVAAGCARRFTRTDLDTGALNHLGVTLGPGGLSLPVSIVPPASQGKYSDRNVHGEVIVRKDLPMETLYHSVEAPNWGDSYNGTHTVDLPHKAYPREFNPPRETEITLECLNPAPGLQDYMIGFRVNEVLARTATDFERRLLENLNLLQENVGACGVEPAHTPIAGYFNSLQLSWEILPPGTKASVLQRLFQGRTPTNIQRDVASDRYDFFQSLKPKQLIFGTSGFRRYFGALLEDDLVLFENIEYGNAIYILFQDWQQLSQRSRLELLSGRFGHDFERVVHTEGWKPKAAGIVRRVRISRQRP